MGRVVSVFATHFANARSVPDSDRYVRVMVHGSVLGVIFVKLFARKLIPKWQTDPAFQLTQGTLTKTPLT